MKKHPVDDLFARKLTDWQPQASSDLWKRIEAGQHKKPRRLSGWYGHAAASAALVLMGGYMVWQSQSAGLPERSREFAAVDQSPQARVDTYDPEAVDNAPPLASVEINKTGPSAVPKEDTSPSQIKRDVSKAVPVIEAQVQVPNPLLYQIEVATIQKTQTDPESLIAENRETASLRSLDILPKVVEESSADVAKGRVIVARIEMDDAAGDDQKSSKFVRILRQLKNAKQGEAIEWEEVGFNPKKLVARADERLRNEEEKVSKKYQQLKDRTKL